MEGLEVEKIEQCIFLGLYFIRCLGFGLYYSFVRCFSSGEFYIFQDL